MNKLRAYPNNNLSNRWTLYGAEIIPNNADMYTYTEPGNYACATNTYAATLKNCPLSRAFDLKVYRSAGGKTDGYIIQEYTAHDAKQRVLVSYNPYTSGTKWGNPIFLVTKDDLPNLFAPSSFPKENVGSNHYQAIQNIWNKLPHAQTFICTVQDDNQFVIVGYIYGNYKYGAVLYLAFNGCGIVKCAGGTFSNTVLG